MQGNKEEDVQRGMSTQEVPQQSIQEVPQQINDRMLKRILIFSGLPVFLGFMLYPLFYYLKVVQHLDIPMWAVYVTQLFTFGGGALGITYGVMSASWDASRDGSLLGWTEFRANLPVILERFKR
eukprot:TRINITY_DN22307_c0_g1_i2.p3 TRINITY_DN22307_c0_g1~~TRINITY_DN22307_c0_g1_i2.p3  ORF type:complete len:124 (+),score=6.94 TRINITY_DN22307_c0_g1_i2:108-479(+)